MGLAGAPSTAATRLKKRDISAFLAMCPARYIAALLTGDGYQPSPQLSDTCPGTASYASLDFLPRDASTALMLDAVPPLECKVS